ncbi:MAG: type VI secretion system baseplate subunit TssF, partial [Methylococcaceae bacterium]|nr:type VI secretion system baseplate subunit TssF [Methylococcaceae bacterium]
MDPRLLKYYNRELQHVREVGAEFAGEFPKIASRLGLDAFECSDPYVERLFEGFAFMAARVQLKVDSEFPTFTQHLLDIVYPHYLSSTPSMTVVEFNPDLSEEVLADGFVIPKGTSLRSQIAKGEQTACEYQTAHPLQLLPLEVIQLQYLPSLAAISSHGIAAP